MAFTVTATETGATFNGMSLAVKVLTGAVEAGGASSAGCLNASVAAGGGASAFTPNTTNSLPLWVLSYDGSTAFTIAANNTAFDSLTSPNSIAHGYYSGAVTASTAITVGSTAPVGAGSGGGTGWGTYEIKPSGGSAPVLDGSSPIIVTTSSAITATTASFNPPAGSVLAALVWCFASGSGIVGMTITDTSGLGLVWTGRALGNTVSGMSEACFIYTATVPGGVGILPQQTKHRMPAYFTRLSSRHQGGVYSR